MGNQKPSFDRVSANIVLVPVW